MYVNEAALHCRTLRHGTLVTRTSVRRGVLQVATMSLENPRAFSGRVTARRSAVPAGSGAEVAGVVVTDVASEGGPQLPLP